MPSRSPLIRENKTGIFYFRYTLPRRLAIEPDRTSIHTVLVDCTPQHPRFTDQIHEHFVNVPVEPGLRRAARVLTQPARCAAS